VKIRYIHYGTLVADVEIPVGAQIYHEEHKLKIDRLILTNIRPLIDHILWSDPEFCKTSWTAVSRNGFALQYVQKQTDELCMVAVEQTGFALVYVEKLSDELVQVALQFMKNLK
jgi:hypothetical protein